MGRGRPTKFSEELAEKFFQEYTKEGGTIEKASKAVGIDFSTFYQWTESNEQFSQLYARARKIKATRMFEEIVQISDDVTRDMMVDGRGDEVANHAAIARAKLRVDTRKWIMAKVLPKLYGEDLRGLDEGEKSGTRPSVQFVFSDKPTSGK